MRGAIPIMTWYGVQPCRRGKQDWGPLNRWYQKDPLLGCARLLLDQGLQHTRSLTRYPFRPHIRPRRVRNLLSTPRDLSSAVIMNTMVPGAHSTEHRTHASGRVKTENNTRRTNAGTRLFAAYLRMTQHRKQPTKSLGGINHTNTYGASRGTHAHVHVLKEYIRDGYSCSC